MVRETQNYLFEEKVQKDKNIGVIHVYRKVDDAWVGFIRYVKQTEENKPFVKFYGSDLSSTLEPNFQSELAEFSQSLSKQWQEEGNMGFKVKNSLEVKFNMIIDKGDGSEPKHVVT